jgi:hypothetical protein
MKGRGEKEYGEFSEKEERGVSRVKGVIVSWVGEEVGEERGEGEKKGERDERGEEERLGGLMWWREVPCGTKEEEEEEEEEEEGEGEPASWKCMRPLFLSIGFSFFASSFSFSFSSASPSPKSWWKRAELRRRTRAESLLQRRKRERGGLRMSFPS